MGRCLQSWWIAYRRKNIHEIEGIALLSDDHSIVTLDANEEDLLEARGVADEIQKLTDILYSDAATAIDDGLKTKLQHYIKTKSKTVAQQNVMDAINISSEGVARDVIRKMDVAQRQTEIEHLLCTVTAPTSLPTLQVESKTLQEKEEYNPVLKKEGKIKDATKNRARVAVLS